MQSRVSKDWPWWSQYTYITQNSAYCRFNLHPIFRQDIQKIFDNLMHFHHIIQSPSFKSFIILTSDSKILKSLFMLSRSKEKEFSKIECIFTRWSIQHTSRVPRHSEACGPANQSGTSTKTQSCHNKTTCNRSQKFIFTHSSTKYRLLKEIQKFCKYILNRCIHQQCHMTSDQ